MLVRNPFCVRLAIIFAIELLTASAGFCAEVDFSRDVLPILSNKCFVCHGPDADEDQLRLDSEEAATENRGGYHAIDAKAPDESAILERIHDKDDPMPPEDAEKQLTDVERDVLDRWVRGGGAYAKHWAFVRPKKTRRVSINSAIDAHIADRLKTASVDFAQPAERATLARRVALVLTGLPPEPEQLERFLRDKDADAAYKRLVEELLSSPRFGEHQARYWLDAVRYGDTHGLHLDNRRGIYPYRDWVVRAFNDNLPINDFITWQLAGDLLPDPTTEQRIATGFVRLNPTTGEGGAIAAEFQAKNNFDRTETLGTVLLGMSLTCARCHTHKYDPIPHDEYYGLFAFFNNTTESALDGNKYDYAPAIKVPADQTAWSEWKTLVSRRDELSEVLESGGEDVGESVFADIEKVSEGIVEAENNFVSTLVALDRKKPRETRRLDRGEYDQPVGDPIEPGVLSVMGSLPSDAPRNRLGLAQWLTAEEHPTVSRVLVNRLWQRVFGYGLVRTPEDFGLQGQQPTHPVLLDWLAVELIESGWDHKKMLRLMVQSRTFKQDSAFRKEVDDPENRLWARGPSYRLDAEVIRDLALWTSGLLDPHMGGEGVKPYQPPGLWKALAHPASNTKEYKPGSGKQLYRRSLYVYWKRTSPHPMMILFDAPDRESSCVRRSRTSTALQSLGLFNETQRLEMGRSLAERLLLNESNDTDRVKSLFKQLACREPTKTEQQACEKLLEKMRKRYADAPDDAVAVLSVGEGKRNEELDATEQAAWAQVAMVVLASDLALMLY